MRQVAVPRVQKLVSQHWASASNLRYKLQILQRTHHRCASRVVIVRSSTELQTQIVYAVAAAANHDSPGHPECAARIPAILTALETAGLTSSARPQQIEQLTGFRSATAEEVLAVHRAPYLEHLQRVVRTKAPSAVESAPTYVTYSSYADAFHAVGAALSLVDRVVEASASCGGGLTGFGICRPPGHHALPAAPMGFCLFSSIAIAARYAQQRHHLSRVMIFDFDVHHGNGTNDVFVDDPSVLFVSTHQSGSYPGTGRISEVGTGDGQGATINIPLPGDSGDSAIMAAFEEIVGPAAERFRPDIILVSAGYDAHWRDPIAGHQLRTASYHALASRLQQLADRLCQGRLVFLLEGGYDLKALGESVGDTFRGILSEASGDRFSPDLLREEPLDAVRAVLREARSIHGL